MTEQQRASGLKHCAELKQMLHQVAQRRYNAAEAAAQFERRERIERLRYPALQAIQLEID